LLYHYPFRIATRPGFLFKAPLKEHPDRSIILLISNRHVFGDAKRQIVLNFHKKSANDKIPLLADVVTLSENEFSSIYIPHPNPDVDLACLNVSGIDDPKLKIFYKNITSDLVSKFDEKELLPGGEVWFVGYPDNRFDNENNLPIVRRGYIASAPKVDFNGLKQFVIDAQVFPGSSGSPLFGILGDKYRFLGVVRQTMIKNEMLQVMPTNLNYGVQQDIGSESVNDFETLTWRLKKETEPTIKSK
jgi:hypothetical protein